MTARMVNARGPFDPAGFDASLEPAVVHLASGDEVLVAHHEPAAGGWLYLFGWGGSRVGLPPASVAIVEVVETTNQDELDTRKCLVDDELRSQAKQAVENGTPELADGLASIVVDADSGGEPRE